MFYVNMFNEFSCIGGDCVNNCCRRWTIRVDEDTARFYQSLTDDYGRMIQEFMKKREDGTYYLPTEEVPQCLMMTEDKLCGVYQRYGENRMGKTCRTFPRMNIEAPNGVFSIATVVNECEEVLRILMDTEEPLAIRALSAEDKKIRKSDSVDRQVLGFTEKCLDMLQDTEIPIGLAIGSMIAMIVDMAPGVYENNVDMTRDKLRNADGWTVNIRQVLEEFSEKELSDFSWGIALRILVGFLDILFVSNFNAYDEILPISEKYTDQGAERGNQILAAFQKYYKEFFPANEMLFRRIIGCIFLQYSMAPYREKAREELLYEMAPRILISLVVPALWPDEIWQDRKEFLPRLSMLQRIAKGDYMKNHLSPAIRDQMGVDEGTYAVMFPGVLM